MCIPRIGLLVVSSALFTAASTSLAVIPGPSRVDIPAFPNHSVTPITELNDQGVPEVDPPSYGHRLTPIVGVDHEVGVYERANRVTRVYGKSFSHGATPRASAEAFLSQNAQLFDAEFEDFVPIPQLDEQPIMYNRTTGTFKFAGMNYTQVRDGLPVFRSRLVLLTRNDADYPLVHASADVRPLANFRFDAALTTPSAVFAYPAAQALIPGVDRFEDQQLMIWAGVEDMFVEPRPAWVFIGERGDVTDFDYGRWLFVVDAETNEMLYTENMILHFSEVQGQILGNVTQNISADFCAGVATEPLPYARAWISGGQTVFADVNGNFSIPAPGGGTVTVNNNLQGQFFRISNQSGSDAVISRVVDPPGSFSTIFNASDGQFTRAEVNAYLHSNVVRDFVLHYNPAYPTIGGQTNFLVNVNIDSNCNAFYNGSSINFYTSGGGCANTAFSTVVYHEYGHHLVAVAGSGQGAYGEGMSDCVAVIITDDPGLGYGFSSGCGTPLRNANNNCQYSPTSCTTNCGSAIHSCGRLISGCIWDLRNELLSSKPSEYRDILASLTLNSILLHTGSSIDPSITIDFMTLDDDDDDILNGTPNYNEIQAAFSAHNMPGPEIPELGIGFPQGLPNCVRPDGSTVVTVEITALLDQPNPGTARLFVSTGGSYVSTVLNQVGPTTYQANFPAAVCQTENSFFVQVASASGQVVRSPLAGPLAPYRAYSAYECTEVFSDDFENNLGWTVTNFGGLTDGAWDRGVPIPWSICNRGNPSSDADGSGQAFLTANRATPSCNSDVDAGTTSLRSPVIDASSGGVIGYWRWYSNTDGANPNVDVFRVFLSSDAGTTWVPLEVVGPAGAEADGGWYYRSFNIEDFVPATSQLRVRFDASDLGPQAIVEAAVDGVTFMSFGCDATCPSDLDGNGIVDLGDLLAMLAAWGSCGGCAADLDGNGIVDLGDLLAMLAQWGSCD